MQAIEHEQRGEAGKAAAHAHEEEHRGLPDDWLYAPAEEDPFMPGGWVGPTRGVPAEAGASAGAEGGNPFQPQAGEPDPTDGRGGGTGSNGASPIRSGSSTPAEEENSPSGTLEADPDPEKACTKTTLEACGDAEVYVHHRVSSGQLRWINETLDRAATIYDVEYPMAMRAGLIHVLFCYAAYRYRYDASGVPMPWYVWARLALRYDGAVPQKTADVWGPLVAAGILEARRFRDGLCRRFELNPEVAVAFAEARGDTTTRYDAMTEKKTRAKLKTNLTYGKGHSWKEKSELVYDVLSYWKGARCLANKPAMEAHLQAMREEADAAQEAAEAAGRELDRVERLVRQSAPYGPLTVGAYAPIARAKEAYRRARRAADSAMSAYSQDAHCWGIACDQDMKPAEGFPEGIVEFTPAYEVQMVSGRLSFIGGGPQGLSRRGKAAFYSGIHDGDRQLVNYDIKESQTRKLLEEFEDAIAAGADLDKSVLTDYEGKDVLAERHGVSRDVFKRAEHAPKFGAGFPHHTFRAAWAMASTDAYEKVQDHGWGHGAHRFRIWEERVARELLTMAATAYDVANDPGVPGLTDPEGVYALLKRVYGPMTLEIKKWREWLVTEHWKANNKAGGDGRFVEGPCGFAFNPHHYDEKEREAKYATNRLQGGEAAYVHHLTLLGAKYGYEAIANEHDGLVVLGTIPQEAIEEARRLSGFRGAEIEPKRLWKHSPVGLPTVGLPTIVLHVGLPTDVTETEDTPETTPCEDAPCAPIPTPEATAGPSTSSSAPTASATRPSTARTASGSSAGTPRPARRSGHRSGASASPTRPCSSTGTSSTRSSGGASPASSTSTAPSGTRTATETSARR